MEGVITVVDDPDEADVLLATPRKRTGKEVPLAEVGAAAGAGAANTTQCTDNMPQLIITI